MITWTKHFYLEEVMPKGYTDVSWLNPKLGELMEAVREVVGPIVVNDYIFGGNRQWRGLRLSFCPEWSVGSQHSFLGKGRHLCSAFDGIPTKMSAKEAREKLLKADIPLLGRMEDKVNWLHCDLGPRKNGEIYLFSKG